MRYRKSKHYLYLGFRKSTLLILALLLALSLTGLFVHWLGQEAIITPIEESNPTSLITYDDYGYPKDIDGNWIEDDEGYFGPLDQNRPHLEGNASWYGTGIDECLGCGEHYDENGLYFVMANGERLDDSKATMACGVYNSCHLFPVGSRVLVENVGNGMFAEVRVTDTGSLMYGTPDVKIADLSKAVMKKIGAKGNPRVRIFRIKEND